MQYQETILCSSGASSSSQGHGAVTLHDSQTGSLLASFKQTSAGRHCTVSLPTKNGQGGFILAAQSDKSILNVYHFQKDQIALKIVLPEKLSCIAIDRRGDLCSGGTSQGRIYLWEIASGILFNVWDAHYRKVSVLRFTQDSAALISGSEDSGVAVWSVSSLLANELMHEAPTPFCTLSDHTLPITDIACGTGTFPSCRILTASLDHSVKLWDLSSQVLLTTFLFPGPIDCLTFETAERTFFASSSGGTAAESAGTVYQADLFRRRDAQRERPGVEAIGGGGSADAVRLDSNPKRTILVREQISSLALSLTQSILLVGTVVGQVHLYDVSSHQLLRTIAPFKDKAQDFTIAHIECILKPPDLIGHVSLSINVGGVTSAKENMPTRPIANFQRIRDGKAREAHEVSMLLPAQNESHDDPTIYTSEELLRDHATFIQSQSHAAGNPASNGIPLPSQQARLAELESEVQHLRGQLAKAKGINDAMWEEVVRRRVSERSDGVGSVDST